MAENENQQYMLNFGDNDSFEFASMEAQYIIVQSDNGIIRVLFFFVLFVW